jgi:hypothetical protein
MSAPYNLWVRRSNGDAGSVTVLMRTDTPSIPPSCSPQATKGVFGTVETSDQFGAALAYREPRSSLGTPMARVRTSQ